MHFKRWNTLLGWLVFLNALVTYTLTMEPTVSFWDTGEYIATSANLGVAHPPGAPLFQLIGAVFSIFAVNKGHIAMMTNFASCLASAFTIYFLFLTITNLAEKLILKKYHASSQAKFVVLFSGLVGSLTFTYSDSFWFNATETEVYAMASCIMALLLWLGIKWTDNLEVQGPDKWLLLICFIIGLTFGVQFMGFLAIPSIVLLFCFNRWKTITVKRFLLANVVGVVVLFFVFKFSLTYVLKFFAWGEIFLVNEFGLRFNMGTLLIGLFMLSTFIFLLHFTYKRGLVWINTVTLCFFFLFMGFSTWLMLPLRASVHVGINENDPADARTLLAYYNREQYPSVESPFYGSYYTDRFSGFTGYKDDNPKYERDEAMGKYIVVNDYEDAISIPNKNHVGWFPRMWSAENAENYMLYFGAPSFDIKPAYRSNSKIQTLVKEFKSGYPKGEIVAEGYVKFLTDFGDYINVQPPNLGDNLRYLFEYQLGYMYLRYFLWNFVGRQNDIQGRYDNNGNWLSGFSFIDFLHLGSQNHLPKEQLENKGRNTYFFLPLLLGLVGMFVHFRSDWKSFWVLLVFFLLAGVGIQFYTNPHIFQPRERDYSLVGSFYIFSIWISLGVYGLYRMLKVKQQIRLLLIASLIAIPLLMAFQNWDDHDRSGRYTARASAKAYLDSTQQNAGAILFTIGDNDNFPLWYLQEVENYRNDVRVIVTGYFATDWYIDQMKRTYYDSEPIPSQLTHEQYRYGTRDVVHYHKLTDKRWDIKDFMNWMSSDHPQTKLGHLLKMNGADLDDYPKNYQERIFYPTNKIRIPVNKEKVLANGLVKPEDAHKIVDYIDIDLPETYLTKNRLMMLDIIANNDWERPIYFSGGSFDDAEYIWMNEYLQLDGLAYKLVPIRTETNGYELGRVDADLSYEIVKNWDWGNAGSKHIYHDSETRKQFGVTFRMSLARLVEQLIKENKLLKAKEVIELAMKHIPFEHYGYYAFVEPFLEGYYEVGDIPKARSLFAQLTGVYQESLQYYAYLPLQEQTFQIENIISDLQSYQRCIAVSLENNDTEFASLEDGVFNTYISKFDRLIGE